VNGTDQFANLASGTSFSNDSQLPSHVFLLLKTTKIDNPPPVSPACRQAGFRKGGIIPPPFFKGRLGGIMNYFPGNTFLKVSRGGPPWPPGWESTEGLPYN
jgi:hypothetical protein